MAASCPPARRWAPNLPGHLTRGISRRLGVNAAAAMRIALLYGDIEWLAAGSSQLRYSASDYARRQGMHRHTVHADLRRLQELGAISVWMHPCHGAELELHGLGCLHGPGTEEGEAAPADLALRGTKEETAPCRSERQPCRSERQPPCRSERHPPGDGVDTPLAMGSTPLEKGLKAQEKRREEKSNPNPPPPPVPEESKGSESSASKQPPEPSGASWSEPNAGSSPEPKPASGSAPASRPGSGPSSKPETLARALARAPEPEQASAALPPPSRTSGAGGVDGLLADLLATFRLAAPAEWSRPGSLTLTTGRRSKLQGALAHAGSPSALQEQLRKALAHVPPWFRTTYPLRPDGSRRPSHQFFDLLFRAAASEREGGPEAWHLFAWSEAAERSVPAGSAPQRPGASAQSAGSRSGHGAPAQAAAVESDAMRAQRLFCWGGSSWLLREIEALQLPMAERRRLTGLLEHQGQGTPGAGSLQFADPPGPASSPPPMPPLAR